MKNPGAGFLCSSSLTYFPVWLILLLVQESPFPSLGVTWFSFFCAAHGSCTNKVQLRYGGSGLDLFLSLSSVSLRKLYDDVIRPPQEYHFHPGARGFDPAHHHPIRLKCGHRPVNVIGAQTNVPKRCVSG